jgi:DNA-binding transcriptional regulator LsrR (DeoR family)
MAESSEFLARIAYLYYIDELTQQEIANRVGTSRPKIARLLKEARRTGIVRISISQQLPPEQKESYDLQSLFGLRRAIVVRTEENRASTLQALRSALAALIVENLNSVRSVGFSFSQTIGNIADYMHTGDDYNHVPVCDLMGAMMGFPMPYTASADVAKRIGGILCPISAPIMVMDPKDRQTYLTDPNIRKTMDVARRVDFAVVGIGDFTTQNILYRSGYINEEIINNLRRQGIVGEMCMRFFDLNGSPVVSELDERVISVPWETLAGASHLVAVSSGSHKIRPTLGALKTGIVHTLVTDLETARNILKLHRQSDL